MMAACSSARSLFNISTNACFSIITLLMLICSFFSLEKHQRTSRNAPSFSQKR
jgi:hypothetical protein